MPGRNYLRVLRQLPLPTRCMPQVKLPNHFALILHVFQYSFILNCVYEKPSFKKVTNMTNWATRSRNYRVIFIAILMVVWGIYALTRPEIAKTEKIEGVLIENHCPKANSKKSCRLRIRLPSGEIYRVRADFDQLKPGQTIPMIKQTLSDDSVEYSIRRSELLTQTGHL